MGGAFGKQKLTERARLLTTTLRYEHEESGTTRPTRRTIFTPAKHRSACFLQPDLKIRENNARLIQLPEVLLFCIFLSSCVYEKVGRKLGSFVGLRFLIELFLTTRPTLPLNSNAPFIFLEGSQKQKRYSPMAAHEGEQPTTRLMFVHPRDETFQIVFFDADSIDVDASIDRGAQKRSKIP